MDKPEHILLPVSHVFIALTLLAAFLLNLMPWGHLIWVPDFAALVLVFWTIHQPRKVSIGTAFLMGLLMDVQNATLLGENALAYTLLAYLALIMHRRVIWFSSLLQGLQVLVLLLFTQAVILLIRLSMHGEFPGWDYFAQSLSAALLWPILAYALLAPQRRAVNRDDTRPL